MADSQKPNKKRKMNPFAIPAEPRQFCLSLPKLNYSFPAFIVAPMVKQSDLAFRTLCRRQGATVTYTPMLYSTTFASDANYRQMNLEVSAEDRPLAVQFCANEPWTLLKAALAALEFKHIDAIDLNLGCPQSHAQRGHYGSYLLGRKDWPLVYEMLYLLSHTIAIPVTCKIRLLSSLNETIEFCRLLERAGVALIAVHGRTQKSTSRRRAGKADLQAIREICRQSRIPIIANGNICCPADVIRSIRETGAQGVMSAEAILRNPALFSSLNDQNVSTLFHSAPEEFHFDVFKSTMIQMKQKKTSNYAMQLVVAEFEMEADGEWGSNEEKRSNGIDSCLSQQQYSISGRKRKPHTHDISCSFSCSSLTVNDSIFQAREYLKICRLETTCPPPQWIAMHIKYMFEPYIDCILDVKKSLNLLHTPFKFRGVLSVAIAKTHQTLQEKSNFAQSQTHKKLNFRKIDFCKQGESPSARQNTLNVVDKSHSDEVMQNKSECTLVVEKIQNGETNLNDKVAIDAGACVIDSKAFICEDTLSINTDNIENADLSVWPFVCVCNQDESCMCNIDCSIMMHFASIALSVLSKHEVQDFIHHYNTKTKEMLVWMGKAQISQSERKCEPPAVSIVVDKLIADHIQAERCFLCLLYCEQIVDKMTQRCGVNVSQTSNPLCFIPGFNGSL